MLEYGGVVYYFKVCGFLFVFLFVCLDVLILIIFGERGFYNLRLLKRLNRVIFMGLFF